MAIQATLFDLPNTPEEFGVILSPTNLRRLDFSGLDYPTARRAIIEYIRTYFPNDFNDFIASNGIMMITEIIAATTGKISLRSDILANDATLPTATSEEAVVNHLALINQRIKRQTPAIIDVECTIDQPVFTDIEIAPGTVFNLTGSDNLPITYEIYRAPQDWESKIIVPAGKRGVIAWGIEGKFLAPISVISPGGSNQKFVVDEVGMLESPIFVFVTVGGSTEEWKVITEPIERYGPTDKVVEVNFIETAAIFRFGNNITGQEPTSGSTIEFRFRIGGGSRGRIGVNQIDTTRQLTPLPPANAAVTVRFRNISPSNGGTDKETIAQAKQRAPRDFALQRSIVTASDYAQAANSFSHPVFGTISKALATIRTGLNTNLVEIYALSEGPDGVPTKPNAGLKAGLVTFFSDLNVLTDHVVVLDGALHPVDIEMTVVVSRNADATVVKTRVEAAITDYFKVVNWEIGKPFYISNFIEVVEAIDGIAYIDLLKPVNNILPTNKIAQAGSDGVGFNEIVIEGVRSIGYYYEKTSTLGGVRSGT